MNPRLVNTSILAAAALALLMAACGGPLETVERPLLRSAHTDHRGKARLAFLVLGDSGTGGRWQHSVGTAMQEVCAEKGCDFALMTGDNILPSGVESVHDAQLDDKFEAPYMDFGRFDFWAVAGNHDHEGSVRAQVDYTDYSDRWRMPATHFAVPDLPEWLHIYGFDTKEVTAAQVAAARAALCGESGWRFAFGHHPLYSYGAHGGSGVVGKALAPLFDECGVQAYFAGHDHDQEHLTTGSLEQIVQGAAGKLRDIDTVTCAPGDGVCQRFAASTYGFALVEVTATTFEVTFYNATPAPIHHWSASALTAVPAPPAALQRTELSR